jgi:hypothetical protein
MLWIALMQTPADRPPYEQIHANQIMIGLLSLVDVKPESSQQDLTMAQQAQAAQEAEREAVPRHKQAACSPH